MNAITAATARSGHALVERRDSKGSEHHDYIADGVIPRTQPDGSNIGVAVFVAHQEKHGGKVCR